MKNLEFLLFLIYVTATLIKSKLQIHPEKPANLDILKFMMKFLCLRRLFVKICPSLGP